MGICRERNFTPSLECLQHTERHETSSKLQETQLFNLKGADIGTAIGLIQVSKESANR